MRAPNREIIVDLRCHRRLISCIDINDFRNLRLSSSSERQRYDLRSSEGMIFWLNFSFINSLIVEIYICDSLKREIICYYNFSPPMAVPS